MTILAAIDVTGDAENILKTASDLANAYDDQLAVLSVTPEETYEKRRQDRVSRDNDAEYSISQAEKEASRAIEKILDAVLPESKPDGGDVQTIGRVGSPVREIMEAADELDARYLVIGGRKRTPTGKALFGSTTQSVLLDADRPVLTVMGQ